MGNTREGNKRYDHGILTLGLLNISLQQPIKAPDEPGIAVGGNVQKSWPCPEQSRRKGRNHFDERSVLIIRERERREERQVCEFEGSAKWRERRWLVRRSLGEG